MRYGSERATRGPRHAFVAWWGGGPSGRLLRKGQFCRQQRRDAASRVLRLIALGPDFVLDLITMIEVVGESGMHIGEGDGGYLGDDVIGTKTLLLVPDHDVEHTNAVTGKAGAPPADTGNPADPFTR